MYSNIFKKIIKQNENNFGNIAIITIFVVIFFALIFLLIIDISRINTIKTIAKNAADSAALAAAQMLLFFENDKLEISNEIKKNVADNGCNLEELYVEYDKVIVCVSKDLDFAFMKILKIFGLKPIRVFAKSKSEVIYPWDESFGYCKRYLFSF